MTEVIIRKKKNAASAFGSKKFSRSLRHIFWFIAFICILKPVSSGNGCLAGYSCSSNCNGASATCDPCPANTYQPTPTTIPITCTNCDPGFFSPPTSASCTACPTALPTVLPTVRPTMTPTIGPTAVPTVQPTFQPTATPTFRPSYTPSFSPTFIPTAIPTYQPTFFPTVEPTKVPTYTPTFSPTRLPTSQPSNQPTRQPTSQPTSQPSRQPTMQPTTQPSSHPSRQPSSQPTVQPTHQPTNLPSRQPTSHPTRQPSTRPTAQPSSQPSRQPTRQPTSHPTSQPSGQPSRQPSCRPSMKPSMQPSSQPSIQPSKVPTTQPSRQPTSQPSRKPTSQPSCHPSTQPTRQPSSQPAASPTTSPSRQPSNQPTVQPTATPSFQPTAQPTSQPTRQPSTQPSSQPSNRPSNQPSSQPSRQPTILPTSQPTIRPSSQPSQQPSTSPTTKPSTWPSSQPSNIPSNQPTSQPTSQPTQLPSGQPTLQPVGTPSSQPSSSPSSQPSIQPSTLPSSQPSTQPTTQPSKQPTQQPTAQPSAKPSSQPSSEPTSQPSTIPTNQPTNCPSTLPSSRPTMQPSATPTSQPTVIPSAQPSDQPSSHPTSQPTSNPTSQPSMIPSWQPSVQPTSKPTCQPSSTPSITPTVTPSTQPSTQPSSFPSCQPSGKPSSQPSSFPSAQPSVQPTLQPSVLPTTQPSSLPTSQPITNPTALPSPQPSSLPTMQPSVQPTSWPSSQPSSHPSDAPTTVPTSRPSTISTSSPTGGPSSKPTSQPVSSPTSVPSGQPSQCPVSQPTFVPTIFPTCQPSSQPTSRPSCQPSFSPSTQPSSGPTSQPSMVPTSYPSILPSSQPSQSPTTQPSRQPTSQPSSNPSSQPSLFPTLQPSTTPTSRPSGVPTQQPSVSPSVSPTSQPTIRPSSQPTRMPTSQPSNIPTQQPTVHPSSQPTNQPSSQPTFSPTTQPSSLPTRQPTTLPSSQPSEFPTDQPSSSPTGIPSSQPLSSPSSQPTTGPTRQPTVSPTINPTSQPSSHPTSNPSSNPSSQPSTIPSQQPSNQPSSYPSSQPSNQPTSIPTAQPSRQPTTYPTGQPTSCPSTKSTSRPTSQPTGTPTMQPTHQPTSSPSGQPSSIPSNQPTTQPTVMPSSFPTSQPSFQPSKQPTSIPSSQPSSRPSSQPTCRPSMRPSSQPTSIPTLQPTMKPTAQPTEQPSSNPTSMPSLQPSSQPSTFPSSQPSCMPSEQPTNRPSLQPSSQPSSQPSCTPSSQPSCQPNGVPTSQPTNQPSVHPTKQPTSIPSGQPSDRPTSIPSTQPSNQPSNIPSTQPSAQPSKQPTMEPSAVPTVQPSNEPSCQPSGQPSLQPSDQPTLVPSIQPTSRPTSQPSIQPTTQPSSQPSTQPTTQPSGVPSSQPTSQPTEAPTNQPTCQPTALPSSQPTLQPTGIPSNHPTGQPSEQPTVQPSSLPTSQPSSIPSVQPTLQPTDQPTFQPSDKPSIQPTAIPSSEPTSQPTSFPTIHSTSGPTSQPSLQPSTQPIAVPTGQPSSQPSLYPSLLPTGQPSLQPTRRPSSIPTSQPSLQPSMQPSSVPSVQPVSFPSSQPSNRPSIFPSNQPTSQPSHQPSSQPSVIPSFQPTFQPTTTPTSKPTLTPILSHTYSRLFLLFAEISVDLSIIDVEFSIDTNEYGGPGLFSCSKVVIFSVANISVSCRWVSPMKLRVFSNSITLWNPLVANVLSIGLSSTSAINSVPSGKLISYNETVLVAWNQKIQVPYVSMTGYIRKTDFTLVIDFSMTRLGGANSGERGWENIDVSVSTNAHFVNATGIETDVLRSLKMSLSGVVAIDRSHYLLTNFDGTSSSKWIALNVRLCADVSVCSNRTVVIDFPLNTTISPISTLPFVDLLLPTARMSIPIHHALVVRGEFYFPSQVTSLITSLSSFSCLWNFTTSINGSDRSISSTSADPTVFRIPAFGLTLWSMYNLTVSVLDTARNNLISSRVLQIVVVPPLMNLDGLPNQKDLVLTLGQSVTLIGALSSYDVPSSLLYEWTCISKRTTNARLSYPCALNVTGSSFTNRKNITLLALSRATINTTTIVTLKVLDLSAPSWYNQTMSISWKIAVIPQIAPTLIINTKSNALKRIRPSDGVTVQASVAIPSISTSSQRRYLATSSDLIFNASWSWTSSLFPLSSIVGNSSILSISLRPGQSGILLLSIPGRNLVESGHYTFRLTCGDQFTDVSVTTNQPPFGGSFAIFPSTGFAFDTAYILSAPGWKDDSWLDSDSESFPLKYYFSFATTATKWVGIPSPNYLSQARSIFLPSRLPNSTMLTKVDISGSYLPLRLMVFDTQSAYSTQYSAVQVLPPASSTYLSARNLLSLVQNITSASSLLVQQIAVGLISSYRMGSLPLSEPDRYQLAKELLQVTNKSVLTTDVDSLPDAMNAVQMAKTFLGDASLAYAIWKTKVELQQNSNPNSLLSNLLSTLLSGNGTGSVSVSTDNVKIAVTVSTISPNRTNFPPISLPDSSTSITIAQPSGGSGTAVISVIEYTNKNHTNNIASSIVSIQVDILNGNSSAPKFVADLAVTPITSVTQVLEHNCTQGIHEHVSLFCTDSRVWLNLTCSGYASARVRRSCPVAERVCSVVSMSTLQVTSNDYCQTSTSSSGTSVVCTCGFSSSNNTNNVGTDGSINLAVTTKYVPSNNIGGSVSISTASLGGNIAEQSSEMFMVFGSLWIVAIVLIGFNYYSASEDAQYVQHASSWWKKKKIEQAQAEETLHEQKLSPQSRNKRDAVFFRSNKRKVAPQSTKLPISKRTLYHNLHQYLYSVIPRVYHQHSAHWVKRLWFQLRKNHRYVKIAFALIFKGKYDKLPLDGKGSVNEKEAKTPKQILEEEEDRKNAVMLDIVHLVTFITLSFCLLAVLYDFQYPVDDGSCELFVKKHDCLMRTSLLDPSFTVCKWHPHFFSAGMLSETQNGAVLEVMTIEDLLGADIPDLPSCSFNGNNTSMLASVLAIVIAATFSAPLAAILEYIFHAVHANHVDYHQRRKQLRRVVREQLPKQHNKVLPVVSSSASTEQVKTANVNHHVLGYDDDDDDDENNERPLHMAVPRRPVNKQLSADLSVPSTGMSEWLVNIHVQPAQSTSDSTPLQMNSISVVSAIDRHSKTRGWFRWLLDGIEDIVVEYRAMGPAIVKSRFDFLNSLAMYPNYIAPKNSGHANSDALLGGTGDINRIKGQARKLFKELQEIHHVMPISHEAIAAVASSSSSLPSAVGLMEVGHESVATESHETTYGVTILHALLGDIIGQDNPARKLFLAMVEKDFTKHTAGSIYARIFGVALILIINCGALVYIVLKGLSRGKVWQRQYLSACLLDLVGEICFVETMEVCWVDFVLPLWIYRDVVRGLKRLVHVADKFFKTHTVAAMMAMKRNRNKTYDTEPPLVGEEPLASTKSSPMLLLSHLLAEEHHHLWESQLALSYHPKVNIIHHGLFRATKINIDSSPVKPGDHVDGALIDDHKSWNVWMSRQLLFIAVLIPLEIHRLLVVITAALFLGVVVFVWYLLKPYPYGKAYFAMIIIVSVFILGSVLVYLIRRKAQMQMLIQPVDEDEENQHQSGKGSDKTNNNKHQRHSMSSKARHHLDDDSLSSDEDRDMSFMMSSDDEEFSFEDDEDDEEYDIDQFGFGDSCSSSSIDDTSLSKSSSAASISSASYKPAPPLGTLRRQSSLISSFVANTTNAAIAALVKVVSFSGKSSDSPCENSVKEGSVSSSSSLASQLSMVSFESFESMSFDTLSDENEDSSYVQNDNDDYLSNVNLIKRKESETKDEIMNSYHGAQNHKTFQSIEQKYLQSSHRKTALTLTREQVNDTKQALLNKIVAWKPLLRPSSSFMSVASAAESASFSSNENSEYGSESDKEETSASNKAAVTLARAVRAKFPNIISLLKESRESDRSDSESSDDPDDETAAKPVEAQPLVETMVADAAAVKSELKAVLPASEAHKSDAKINDENSPFNNANTTPKSHEDVADFNLHNHALASVNTGDVSLIVASTPVISYPEVAGNDDKETPPAADMTFTKSNCRVSHTSSASSSFSEDFEYLQDHYHGTENDSVSGDDDSSAESVPSSHSDNDQNDSRSSERDSSSDSSSDDEAVQEAIALLKGLLSTKASVSNDASFVAQHQRPTRHGQTRTVTQIFVPSSTVHPLLSPSGITANINRSDNHHDNSSLENHPRFTGKRKTLHNNFTA